MFLINGRSDLERVAWNALPHPCAIEYIDTRCRDGHYRKYRYLVTGKTGIARHLVVADRWCVHARDRIRGDEQISEELAFTNSSNPFHDQLVAAREALELDFVAFDYSVDANGNLVVWEPNPYPCLWSSLNERDPYYEYQHRCIANVFEHVLSFCLERAKR